MNWLDALKESRYFVNTLCKLSFHPLSLNQCFVASFCIQFGEYLQMLINVYFICMSMCSFHYSCYSGWYGDIVYRKPKYKILFFTWLAILRRWMYWSTIEIGRPGSVARSFYNDHCILSKKEIVWQLTQGKSIRIWQLDMLLLKVAHSRFANVSPFG